MRFNPSSQSYGSNHFYTDEHGNIKMTHDINVATGQQHQSRQEEAVSSNVSSGPASILLQTPPPKPPPNRSAARLQRRIEALRIGNPLLLIGGIVLVIAWDPLKAIWRSK